MEIVLEIAKDFGIPVAVLFVFIWRDYKREQRQNIEREQLAERINKVEDYQRNDLEKLIKESTQAILTNANTQKQIVQTLNLRPCIAKHIPNGG